MGAQANQEYVRQVLHRTEPPPPIEARFFYTSPLPIDDPLSPVPPPTSGKAAPNQPPKPFSTYDNAALDKAWHELRRKILKYNEEHEEKPTLAEGSRARAGSRTVRDVRSERRSSGSKPGVPRSSLARQAAASLGQVEMRTEAEASSPPPDEAQSSAEPAALPDTTGTPFIRAPSGKRIGEMRTMDERPARPRPQQHDTYTWEDASHLVEHSPAPEKRRKDPTPRTSVPVGVSRLHQVDMPELIMQPIYWVPIHDTAQVVRGTWFYQDTMLPVETAVANMLEAGYVELQVWTQTWKDELESAVEVGAAGEVKIMHKLWPEKVPLASDSRPSSRRETPEQLHDKAVEAACDIIDISTGPGGADNKAAGTTLYGRGGPPRSYTHYGVIYANEREARLLQPSLLPSAYYGRRPLANYIRKGHKLGIPVVRGFNPGVWDRLHPAKATTTTERAEQGVATSSSGVPPRTRRKTDPDLAKAERPQVTDLVLVIHGIGQMLSQRMESWHFTHAMNAFRRDVNVQVGTPEVKARFREDMGGIMVLPVNWRHSLTFEEGGYRDGADANDFTLADITPETLPSVRNIISDVLSDIPYYLSHHQPKMIAAVVREANRVYQLWCQNNAGFADYGRVHIIGHSLGSVLSIDILSRQPTVLPKSLHDPAAIDIANEDIDHFIFNTSNLFLAGSPAGFFLLLKKAQLLPRLDQPSAAANADPASNQLSICGERGQYGCIAVENLYNIVNGYDPVSYRLNAAVDASYSASIKPAYIPTSTAGWFGARGSTTWFAGAGSSTATSKAPTLPRLPSNVEMETHNFTREEIAEKRMYLLNDNGQIDYFLRYGGGPLEIQYLTMLGAHSSYWLLRDFARMIVTEVGRPPGREGTLFAMRAVKRKVPLS
ncbi:hypothetical protein BAUCODRAFT_298024 [Baudoinia panamericana UAMH 10762]|uniref:DDHD domain-containing protein n=1 Tax=Baudoinia panamericana (strain UAMH 10762) TaxID=717646 RepID=M2MY37_BAUPA|nr:uncharacterized protein BAUCODRAFT_298024 [Baudoinia panamericana UAMH 10762]EMC91564.1 hypothetical protein BAUCODRAFT_298024 [Baudoinia panamericana UAMH 10762]